MDALIYLNLALSKTGRFTSDLMRFPQIGEGGFIPHDPKSRMGLIEASEVAWQVGQVNAAQRFAFVGVLSSQRCVQPRLMKRLVETYLVTGEYRAAEKYIKILYQPNLGNPLPLIREQLIKIYREHPGLQVASVTTNGYGERSEERRVERV